MTLSPILGRAAMAIAAIAAGSGISALPYAENEPCMPTQELGPDRGRETTLFPLGVRCTNPAEHMAAPELEAAAWILAALVLFAIAVLRPHPALEGAVVGAAALGVMGIVYVDLGDFVAAAFLSAIVAPAAGFAIARWRGVLPALVALAVWVMPFLYGLELLAVVAGVLAAAAAALALSRYPARPSPASPAGT